MRGPSGVPCLFLLSTLALFSACVGLETVPEDEPRVGTASSALYAATVTASPSLVELGQTVTASWSAPAEHSIYDWVGMFKVGAADSGWISWKYVGGANNWGEMSIDEGSGIVYIPTGSGTYDF